MIRKKNLSRDRFFIITYDNAKDSRQLNRELGKHGDIENIRYPRTCLKVTPYRGVKFKTIMDTLLWQLRPRLGSAIIFSRKTGKAYQANERGNCRGRVVPLT